MTEDDPTAIEPNDLPPKPPISEPMPTDAELEAMDPPDEEDVDDDEFMNPEEAADDDTIDDGERDADA